MAELDFDQIPAQEQMVDNWGQPTPWMQALWQRLTERIKGEIGRLDVATEHAFDAATNAAAAASTASSAATAAAAASSQALTASSTANAASSQALSASAAATAAVTDAGSALSGLGEILSYFADYIDYQDSFNLYMTAIEGILLQLITILDDPTQPLSPPVVFTSFVNYPLPPRPVPPTPPT